MLFPRVNKIIPAPLDAVTEKYRHHNTEVEVRGLVEASTALYERLSGHLASAR